MFQQYSNPPKSDRLSLVDYSLMGIAGFAVFVAISNFSFSINTIVWLAIAGLSGWYAFDGKRGTLKDFVIIVVLLVCILIALKNLEPYEALVRLVFGADSPPAKLLNFIPVVRNIWAYVLGLMVFLPIQVLEIYVSVLEGNRESLRVALEKARADRDRNPNPNPEQDKRIAMLERQYNDFVIDTYLRFYQYRNAAYCIDAIAVFWHYCPIKGGWAEFEWGFPTLDQWNFPNILLSVIILFLFQQLVEVYLWLRNVDEYFVGGEP